ncbi:MAG TPA: type II toxin-antitoxin system RelE/ParE family toxin [Chthonomonadaceae bacterium]|nr:type II toxin-antitoxin system RelE/ParE family toxin [Chthonomonadaceae bacterium]
MDPHESTPERPQSKPLLLLHGSLKSPPFSNAIRSQVGFLFRQIQNGERFGMPISRPMPMIGPGCHELRLSDNAANIEWRVIYCIASDAILILDVFAKKTRTTPSSVIAACKERLRNYESE